MKQNNTHDFYQITSGVYNVTIYIIVIESIIDDYHNIIHNENIIYTPILENKLLFMVR